MEITQAKSRLSRAEREAQTLLWGFTQEDARKHIDLNLERTEKVDNDDVYEFWSEVGAILNIITVGETDKVEEFTAQNKPIDVSL